MVENDKICSVPTTKFNDDLKISETFCSHLNDESATSKQERYDISAEHEKTFFEYRIHEKYREIFIHCIETTSHFIFNDSKNRRYEVVFTSNSDYPWVNVLHSNIPFLFFRSCTKRMSVVCKICKTCSYTVKYLPINNRF